MNSKYEGEPTQDQIAAIRALKESFDDMFVDGEGVPLSSKGVKMYSSCVEEGTVAKRLHFHAFIGVNTQLTVNQWFKTSIMGPKAGRGFDVGDPAQKWLNLLHTYTTLTAEITATVPVVDFALKTDHQRAVFIAKAASSRNWCLGINLKLPDSSTHASLLTLYKYAAHYRKTPGKAEYQLKPGNYWDKLECGGDELVGAGQGKQKPLAVLCDMVVAGASDREVCLYDKATYARYYRGLAAVRSAAGPEVDPTRKALVVVLEGDPGCGKTYFSDLCCAACPELKAVEISPSGGSSNGGPWCRSNVAGCDVLIVNEFTGDWDLSFFKKCADGPFELAVKHVDAVAVSPRIIFVTSNHAWETWWQGKATTADLGAVRRRIFEHQVTHAQPLSSEEQGWNVENCKQLLQKIDKELKRRHRSRGGGGRAWTLLRESGHESFDEWFNPPPFGRIGAPPASDEDSDSDYDSDDDEVIVVAGDSDAEIESVVVALSPQPQGEVDLRSDPGASEHGPGTALSPWTDADSSDDESDESIPIFRARRRNPFIDDECGED